MRSASRHEKTPGEMYLQDLTNTTEVVLDMKQKVRAPGESRHPHPVMTSGGGGGSRAAAGAIRIGNAAGAAFTNRRVLEPVEARIKLMTGALLLSLLASKRSRNPLKTE
jgi:cardiolipin synthase A/B